MKFFKQTIRDVPIEGKTVLLRTGYDIPLHPDGSIADDLRIRASLPTIKRLQKDGCKIVIVAHLGRPDGVDRTKSLEPAAQRLAELLHTSVRFVDKTVGEKVRMAVKRAPKNSIIVLENLRFNEGEKANSEVFARQLAHDSGAKYFVQDAFSNAHRDDASMSAITLFLPSVAGLLLEKEYLTITDAMKQPTRPLVAILGGAKVADKIEVIQKFVDVADKILIGGAMANTFLSYKGYDMGKSKCEANVSDTIKAIYSAVEAKVGREKIDEFLVVPRDVAVGTSLDTNENRRSTSLSRIKHNDRVLDIGDETIEQFVGDIKAAKTVVWNGTLGYAELPAFAHGSARVAMELATNQVITSIIGGGDTADFVIHWDARQGDSFSHVSTGGGASLELMAGKSLPGIEHLLDARA